MFGTYASSRSGTMIARRPMPATLSRRRVHRGPNPPRAGCRRGGIDSDE